MYICIMFVLVVRLINLLFVSGSNVREIDNTKALVSEAGKSA